MLDGYYKRTDLRRSDTISISYLFDPSLPAQGGEVCLISVHSSRSPVLSALVGESVKKMPCAKRGRGVWKILPVLCDSHHPAPVDHAVVTLPIIYIKGIVEALKPVTVETSTFVGNV